MKSRALLALVAFGTASIAPAQQLWANTYTTASTSTTGNVTAVVGPLYAGSSNNFASSWGSVDYGIHRIYTYHGGWAKGAPGFETITSTTARTRFQDFVTISAPGLDGQTGSLTFQYRVDGTMTAKGGTIQQSNLPESAGAVSAHSRLYVGNGQFEKTWVEFGDGTNWNDHFGSTMTPFLNQTFTETVDFTFGTAFAIDWEVGSWAYAPDDQMDLVVSADLSHTGLWGGFTSVKDVLGNDVRYSTSSLSGQNYAQAVPEPATIAALGLGTVGLLRRRRKA